jgi:hypothetical protein
MRIRTSKINKYDNYVIIICLFARFQNDVFGLSMFVVHGHPQQGGDSSPSFHLAAESPRQTRDQNNKELPLMKMDPDPVDL